MPRDLRLAKVRVIQGELQDGFFKVLAGSIFVVMVVGNLPPKSLRAMFPEDLPVPVNGVARDAAYLGGFADIVELIGQL